jgi:hypothetical protein
LQKPENGILRIYLELKNPGISWDKISWDYCLKKLHLLKH